MAGAWGSQPGPRGRCAGNLTLATRRLFVPLRNAGSPTWRVCRGPRAQGRARDQQGLRKAKVHTGAQRGGIAAHAKPRDTFISSLAILSCTRRALPLSLLVALAVPTGKRRPRKGWGCLQIERMSHPHFQQLPEGEGRAAGTGGGLPALHPLSVALEQPPRPALR